MKSSGGGNISGRLVWGWVGLKPTDCDTHISHFFALRTGSWYPLYTEAMENQERNGVTAEMLMQQVEELLLMDQLSEGEKVKILQNVLSILEEE